MLTPGEFEEKNKRRCDLIHKKYTDGITDDENKELDLLQTEVNHYINQYINQKYPLSFDELNKLCDKAKALLEKTWGKLKEKEDAARNDQSRDKQDHGSVP